MLDIITMILEGLMLVAVVGMGFISGRYYKFTWELDATLTGLEARVQKLEGDK